MVRVLPALLPLLPPPLLLPPLLSLPQAVTPSASAAATQPVAAMNLDSKEPILVRLVFGRRFYARPVQACNSLVGCSADDRAGAHRAVRLLSAPDGAGRRAGTAARGGPRRRAGPGASR